MSLEDLKQVLSQQIKSSGSIAINEATISAAGLTPASNMDNLISNNFLLPVTESLKLKTTPIIPDPQGNQLMLSATGDLFDLKDLTFQVIFSLENSTLHTLIVITLKNSQEKEWNFSDTFPLFIGFPFLPDTFSLSYMLFTTLDTVYNLNNCHTTLQLNLKQGFNLNTKIDVSKFPVLHKATNVFEVYLCGPVIAIKRIPDINFLIAEMNLEGVVNSVVKVPSFDISALKLNLQVIYDINYVPQIFFWLNSILTIESGLTCGFQSPILPALPFLRFNIVPQKDKPLTIDKIVKLVGGEQFMDELPEIIKSFFKEVSFKYFSVSFNPEKLSIIDFGIGITATVNYQLGDLEFKDVTLHYSILNPFNKNLKQNLYSVEARLQFESSIFKDDFIIQIGTYYDKSLIIGGEYEGDININDLTNAISGSKVNIPKDIVDLDFSKFNIWFNKTGEGYNYSLHGTSDFIFQLPFMESNADSNFDIFINKDKESKTFQLRGGITIGDSYIQVSLDLGGLKDIISGDWTANSDMFSINNILKTINDSIPIPAVFDLNLQSLHLDYNMTDKSVNLSGATSKYGKASFQTFKKKNDQATGYYFQAVVQDKIEVGQNLPGIGYLFSDNKDITLQNLAITFANCSSEDVEVEGQKFTKGLNISSKITILGNENDSQLPISSPDQHKKVLTTEEEITNDFGKINLAVKEDLQPANSSQGLWIKIQKNFGPIALSRIGMDCIKDKLELMIDAKLSSSVLSLSLLGLGVSFDMKQPRQLPLFVLHGLGLGLESGLLELNGTLQRDLTIDNKYGGLVTIKAENLNIECFGSYFKNNTGDTSLFAFGVIDYPLGGPPCFTITGGALGFGYNQALLLPDVSKVSSYPFIQAAFHPDDFKLPLDQLLTNFQNIISIENGEYWIAAGLKFTSFELVKGFVLAIASFGTSEEVNIIGIAEASIPSNSDNLIAKIILDVIASFNFAKGEIIVQGKLDPTSYIISQDCHLNGGFAVACWFAPNTNSGDFVVSIGGYHPFFNKPNHYPLVPRINANWKVKDSNLSLEGQFYFALTPTCVMAGGTLNAVWQGDDVRAWFDLSTNILIVWKPYHYDIEVGVSIGISVHVSLLFCSFDVSFHISADIHIWGPEFSGTAHIDLSIVSFTIGFGNSPNNQQSIDWEQFKTSFLVPQSKDLPHAMITSNATLREVNEEQPNVVCNIRVVEGLIATTTINNIKYSIINPEHFEFDLTTKIPIKSPTFESKAINVEGGLNSNFGVGMVEVQDQDLISSFDINIKCDDQLISDQYINLEPIKGNVPKALWQNIDINNKEQLINSSVKEGKYVIENALLGFRLTKKPQDPDKTLPASLENLLYNLKQPLLVLVFNKPNIPTTDSFDQTQSEQKIRAIQSNNSRDGIISIFQKAGYNLQAPSLLVISQQATNNYFINPPILSYLGEEKTLIREEKMLNRIVLSDIDVFDKLSSNPGFNIAFGNKATTDESAAIYVTDDPSYNQLFMDISFNTQDQIAILKPVDLSKASLDQIPILLEIYDTLSNEEISKIQLTKDSQQVFILKVLSIQGQTLIAISPVKEIDMSKIPGDGNIHSITINFTNITAKDKSTRTGTIEYTLNYYINDKANSLDTSTNLPLRYKPDPMKNNLNDILQIEFSSGGGQGHNHNVIYISTDKSFGIQNQLVLAFANLRENKPLIDKGGSSAYFELFFITSKSPDSYGALGSQADINSIQIAVDHLGSTDYGWDCKLIDNKWRLTPKNPSILGYGEAASVTFNITSIVSHLPSGVTVMYINYYNMTGYNDGSFGLVIEKDKPTDFIDLFKTSKDTFEFGEPITFLYKAYGIYPEWQINIVNDSGTPAIQYTKNDLPYTKSNDPSQTIIDSFPAMPGKFKATLLPQNATGKYSSQEIDFSIAAPTAILSSNTKQINLDDSKSTLVISWNITNGKIWKLIDSNGTIIKEINLNNTNDKSGNIEIKSPFPLASGYKLMSLGLGASPPSLVPVGASLEIEFITSIKQIHIGFYPEASNLPISYKEGAKDICFAFASADWVGDNQAKVIYLLGDNSFQLSSSIFGIHKLDNAPGSCFTFEALISDSAESRFDESNLLPCIAYVEIPVDPTHPEWGKRKVNALCINNRNTGGILFAGEIRPNILSNTRLKLVKNEAVGNILTFLINNKDGFSSLKILLSSHPDEPPLVIDNQVATSTGIWDFAVLNYSLQNNKWTFKQPDKLFWINNQTKQLLQGDLNYSNNKISNLNIKTLCQVSPSTKKLGMSVSLDQQNIFFFEEDDSGRTILSCFNLGRNQKIQLLNFGKPGEGNGLVVVN